MWTQFVFWNETAGLTKDGTECFSIQFGMEWDGRYLAGPVDFVNQFDMTAPLGGQLEAEALKDSQKFTATDSTKLGHAPGPVPSSVPVLAFGAGRTLQDFRLRDEALSLLAGA